MISATTQTKEGVLRRFCGSRSSLRSVEALQAHRLALALACAVLFAPLAAAAPASAAFVHNFVGQWATGAGSAEDLAVDSSNNVYVLDEGGHDILKFDSNGNPVNFSALGTNVLDGASNPEERTPGNGFSFEPQSGAEVAIDNSGGPANGEIYVTNHGGSRAINVFSPAGKYLGDLPASFPEPLGVAVNSAGTVLVSDWQQQKLTEFTPQSANPTEDLIAGTLSGLPFRPGYVAIDSTGAGYVSQWPDGPLTKYEADQFNDSGSPTPSPFAPDPFATPSLAFAVDPANNDIYVDSGTELTRYSNGVNGNPAHALDPTFGSGHLSGSRGIAIDDTDKTIFATDGSNNVVKFALEGVIVPDVSTEPAKNPGQTSATLVGHVNPAGGGPITNCHFEYGTTTSYGSGPVPCEPPTPADQEVTANVTGLTAETTYHYRLVASNSNGTNVGGDETFTPHAVLGLSTEPATGITKDEATLHASFTGNGELTHYHFDWGVTPGYGNETAVESSSGTGPTHISALLTGLDPLSTYYFRVVATNGAGTSRGEQMEFTTLPGPPTVSNERVGEVKTDVATLAGQINPNGVDTTYHFEYVDQASFEESGYASASHVPTPDSDIGTNAAIVSRQVGGLKAATTYHFRIVAESKAGGSAMGEDKTFTTFSTGTGVDSCPNAHVRQQTGAALLLDCRAYELVSAANAGGYDVESDLVPGQTPFAGYPEAEEPIAGPLRRPRRRHPGHRPPHQQGRRPLRRHPRRKRLDDRIRRRPRQRPLRDRTLLLDPLRRRRRP